MFLKTKRKGRQTKARFFFFCADHPMLQLTRILAVTIFGFLFITIQIIYFSFKNRKTLRKIISSSLYEEKEDSCKPKKPVKKRHYGEKQVREFIVSIVFAVVIFSAIFMVTSNIYASTVIAMIAPGAIYVAQNIQKCKYSDLFNKNLGDALILGANAMRAGASLIQAVEHIAENAAYPVNLEFTKVSKAVKLGMTVDEAIKIIKDDVSSKETDILITAVHVLMRTGGNMADVFDNMAGIIKERILFKSAVRAMTAQTRMSAMAISIMLVLIVGAVSYLSPGYFDPLIKRYGMGIFVLICGMIAIGWLVIRKLLNVETD